jgi:hypothetical protein
LAGLRRFAKLIGRDICVVGRPRLIDNLNMTRLVTAFDLIYDNVESATITYQHDEDVSECLRVLRCLDERLTALEARMGNIEEDLKARKR